MNTNDFLKTVYGNCDSGFLTITTLPNAKTVWFEISELENAVRYAENQGTHTNVFFGVGLRKNILKNNLRGGENDISCVTALYADIDIKSDAHAQKSLPQTLDEAVDFLNYLALKPSIIVNSGNGIHGYWIFDTPYKITDLESRNRIVSLFKGFGKYINTEAKKRSWKIDNVSDLARILRLPGTLNYKLKTKAKCEVISSNKNRYKINDFSKTCETSGITKTEYDDTQPKNINNMLKKCTFIKYCKENAKSLPEPLWHAMITNMVSLKNGKASIHEFSKPYPNYSKSETDEKIKRAIIENKPHTCEYIKENLNFDCGKCCSVKAPIVFGLPSFEEQFIELVSNKIDASKIFSNENMKLCAWAKTNLPSEYAKLKFKLKGQVNLRDFERAVRAAGCVSRQSSTDNQKSQILELENIDLCGAVVPPDWNISMKYGVRKILRNNTSEEFVPTCSCPLIISRRFENIDDGTQKIEIKFYRDHHWKSVIASRSHIFNRTSIIKYADSGLPVSSGNASDIVKYLSDYENSNEKCIPFVKSISRIGWIKDEFFPYKVNSEIVFETEYKEATNIISSTCECGSFDVWKENANLLRINPFGRFILASSFASPLLEILNHRVFFVHIWHDSKSGKTAAIKMAISVWGNPAKLMGSFNATSVGLERMAGILKHLPFAIDELQVLNNRRLSVENIIYSLGNGFGRLRGAKEGSVQETVSWRNDVLTSGEQPMSKESSNDGVITRVLELYGKPVDSTDTAHNLHLISENNYGFAGKVFIEYLIDTVLKTKGKAQKDFENLRKSIIKKCSDNFDNSHLDNVAVVCLGDYYSSVSVFDKEKEIAWNDATLLGVQILESNKELQKADTTDRAWDFVTGWITSNKNRFLPDSTPCYGKIEQDMVYIIPNILREALEENGFDYSKVTRGFKDRGFIETRIDNKKHSKMQIPKMINGIVQKCFCVTGVMKSEKHHNTNPLN